jgi:hypothetical protein
MLAGASDSVLPPDSVIPAGCPLRFPCSRRGNNLDEFESTGYRSVLPGRASSGTAGVLIMPSASPVSCFVVHGRILGDQRCDMRRTGSGTKVTRRTGCLLSFVVDGCELRFKVFIR